MIPDIDRTNHRRPGLGEGLGLGLGLRKEMDQGRLTGMSISSV